VLVLMGCGKRTKQAQLREPDALSARHERLDGLFGCARSGAHQHEHTLRVRCAYVIDESVAASAALGEASESCIDEARHRVVERLAGLARLEEHVGVLRGAAQRRRVGREPARAVTEQRSLVDENLEIRVREQLHCVHLV
jgi:hypothetical protein